jgi:hypothetical protein
MEIKCICPTCDKEFIWEGSPSHFSRAKFRYCGRECQNVKHSMSRRVDKDPRYSMWLGAGRRCRKSGRDFNIEPNDIPEIPEFCPILGIKLKVNNNGPTDESPSLDRIDSTKGYIKGNIRVISNRANRIKSDATYDELKLIYEDLKKIMNNNENI